MVATINLNKKQKKLVATILFLVTLMLAIYNFVNFNDISQQQLNDEILQEKERIENSFGYVPSETKVELPREYKAMWYILNIIFYLFLGGILYGRIERFDKTE